MNAEAPGSLRRPPPDPAFRTTRLPNLMSIPAHSPSSRRRRDLGTRPRCEDPAIVGMTTSPSGAASIPALVPAPAPAPAPLRRYSARSRFAISIPATAASNPLFPAFVPARSTACSIVSVVSTPKITGTPVSIVTCAIPFVTSPATYS